MIILNIQLVKFIINGLFATGVHYLTLLFCLNILNINSVFISDVIAAIIGITVSYIGNRFFVFLHKGAILNQFLKFIILYGLLALLHGAILTFVEYFLNFDQKIAFLIATSFQVILSYLGNKKVVFNETQS